MRRKPTATENAAQGLQNSNPHIIRTGVYGLDDGLVCFTPQQKRIRTPEKHGRESVVTAKTRIYTTVGVRGSSTKWRLLPAKIYRRCELITCISTHVSYNTLTETAKLKYARNNANRTARIAVDVLDAKKPPILCTAVMC